VWAATSTSWPGSATSSSTWPDRLRTLHGTVQGTQTFWSEQLGGGDDGLDDSVAEQDGYQEPGHGQAGAHAAASFSSTGAAGSCRAGGTGRISRLAMKPTARTPTMVSSAGW